MINKEKYILPILLTIAILTIRRARKRPDRKQHRKHLIKLPDLPGPALVTLSAYLEYSELLTLEQILSFDSSLMGECWKEGLKSNIHNAQTHQEAVPPTVFGQVRDGKALTSKQVLCLAEHLERFKPKTFVLGGIASHFELKPPYHFFKKPPMTSLNARIISFHSVVAAGQFGQVDWLSLNFIVNTSNVEIFVCTGNDSQEEHRTMAIAAPFVFEDASTEELVSMNLVRVVEQLRSQVLVPIVEVLVQANGVKSSISSADVSNFQRRTGVSMLELLEWTRVAVDPPHGADARTHRLVLNELEKALLRTNSTARGQPTSR